MYAVYDVVKHSQMITVGYDRMVLVHLVNRRPTYRSGKVQGQHAQ